MLRLNAYGLRDGNRIIGLPFTDCSWQQSWNEAGSMTVSIPVDDELAAHDPDSILIEQQTALALLDGDDIIHAGPISQSPEWDAENSLLKVTCGGGWSMFEWRLVLDPLLVDERFDGELVIDEDNPAPEWTVAFQGTPGDIARSLINQTKRWADLPVEPSAFDGSQSTTVQWDCWDFTTLSQAFSDALDAGGGQLRFDPYLNNGRLRWRERWSADGVTDRSEPFRWNTTIPGQRVRFTGIKSGDSTWVNDVWATGGKNDDTLLMYRLRDEDAIGTTGMLWQGTVSSSSNSLANLHSIARDALSSSRRDRAWSLQVGAELKPHVGDRVLLRVNDRYAHGWMPDGTRTGTVVPLIITDVSGTAGDEWLTLSCTETGETVNGVRSMVSDPLASIARRINDIRRDVDRNSGATVSQTYQLVAKVKQLRSKS